MMHLFYLFLTPLQLNKSISNNILNIKPYNNYPIQNYKLLEISLYS